MSSKLFALINAAREYNIEGEYMTEKIEFINKTGGGAGYTIEMNVVNYDVVPAANMVQGFLYEPMVSYVKEEINEGFRIIKGRYYRINGKYKTFAKKEEAVTSRVVWAYEHKLKEVGALIKSETPTVSDESTLIHQEGMGVSEIVNEFQYKLAIADARIQPDGTDVVITGTCMEYVNKDLVNMAGYKFSVRHFRLAEFTYSVELVEVGLKPILVGSTIEGVTDMTIVQARNAVENLLKRQGTTTIAKGLTKEKVELVKEAITKAGAQVEILKVEGKSIWVKPGLRVSMIVGTEHTVHGTVRRMSTMQPRKIEYALDNGETEIHYTEARHLSLQGYLSEEEKLEGEEVFVFLSPARFVQFVPEDVTGKTGDESALSDEVFVKRVLGGYVYQETMNPNDYYINPMTGEVVEEAMQSENMRMYGWKEYMVQVTEVRPWNRAELSGMGGGLDDLLTKVVESEQWIESEYEKKHPGVTNLMRRLGERMTGDDTLVATFTDSDGTVQYGEEDIVNAVKKVEDFIWAPERMKYIAKATERLDKHWTARMEGDKILITGGFLHLVYQMDPGMRSIVWSILAEGRKMADEMKVELEKTEWNPNIQSFVKVHDFSREADPGMAWYEAAVKPIANQLVLALQNEFGAFGHKSIPQSLRGGIENAVSIMMRGEILPFKSSQYQEALDLIQEKAAKKKFYGGSTIGQLWKGFTAWQMIKRMQVKEESGVGHVDDPTADPDLARQQMDAEAKFIKGWEPKFPREPRR